MNDNDSEFIPVGNFPAIQRDLYLSRVLRREEDLPSKVETLRVEWNEMIVLFSTNETITECTVEVRPGISMVTFARRVEALLDCGAKSEKSEWTLKWSDKISRFGSADKVSRLLFDKISSVDGETGETIGVLKIKRRSVSSGYARLRLVPTENILQVVCRHTSAQGLKAVWKSAVYRLNPQFPAPLVPVKSSEPEKVNKEHGPESDNNKGSRYGYVLTEPHIRIECEKGSWQDYLPAATRLGAEVDIESARKNGLKLILPLDANAFDGFGRWEWDRYDKKWKWNKIIYNPEYKAVFKVIRVPKGEIPDSGTIDYYGNIEISNSHYLTFRKRAIRIAQWLQIDLDLPEVPAGSNNFQPTAPPQED